MSARLSVFLVALLLAVAGGASRAQPSSAVRLLVPAYFYPAGEGLAEWKRLLESAERAPVVAIVNPDSGPGKRVDDRYSDLFRLAHGTKATLIGYVTLSYGKRPISAVKADVDSWLHFYPGVRGIFFDEQPGGVEQVAFAAECFAYARARIENATLVTNPGVPCAREYLAARDAPIACLFEHETGFDQYQPPEWTAGMKSDRFATLLYAVKTAPEMRKRLGEVVAKRAGYLYITDAAGPMPWGRLPSYWEEEVAAVATRNRGAETPK